MSGLDSTPGTEKGDDHVGKPQEGMPARLNIRTETSTSKALGHCGKDSQCYLAVIFVDFTDCSFIVDLAVLFLTLSLLCLSEYCV